MKFPATVETVGLMIIALAANVVGTPSVVRNKPTSVLHKNDAIAAYGPHAIQALFDTASELFAIQVVGLATSLDQLKSLCQAATSFTPRIESEYYNSTLIQNVICTAAGETALPSVEEIKRLTVEIVTDLWVIQSIGAVQGKSGIKHLFHLINPAAASTIGLNGHVAKNNLRAAAYVADFVAHSRNPGQVKLAPSLKNSTFAPVFEAVLPFIPVKEHHQHKTPRYVPAEIEVHHSWTSESIPTGTEEHHHRTPKHFPAGIEEHRHRVPKTFPTGIEEHHHGTPKYFPAGIEEHHHSVPKSFPTGIDEHHHRKPKPFHTWVEEHHHRTAKSFPTGVEEHHHRHPESFHTESATPSGI
ncbi:hypothetical protein MMC07_002353 [Pseudocyphellaria aurata]|nr:hypothetical protein [Pseudocyphellaria aurata]